ncbi:hypothetical protein E4U43_006360, partial [Claviceps pusilla]
IATWFLSETAGFRNDRPRPRGMIHYGTIDGPEGARLLPGVVGEDGEAAEEGAATRAERASGEDEGQNARGDANGVTVQGGSTQDNPWQ